MYLYKQIFISFVNVFFINTRKRVFSPVIIFHAFPRARSLDMSCESTKTRQSKVLSLVVKIDESGRPMPGMGEG